MIKEAGGRCEELVRRESGESGPHDQELAARQPNGFRAFFVTTGPGGRKVVPGAKNASGTPFRVLKGGKPWVVVSPVSSSPTDGRDGITIQPVKRTVPVVDLDALFAGYDGGFVPHEDGFAGSAGSEEI